VCGVYRATCHPRDFMHLSKIRWRLIFAAMDSMAAQA
jgi:hypothetical protein